jgi:phosphatidate cytidylyltransferase
LRLDKRHVGSRDDRADPATRRGVPVHGDSGATPGDPGPQPGRGGPDRAGGGPGRAGRNLPIAVATGLVLGGPVFATLFTVKATFLAYVGAIVAVASWELRQALGSRGIRVPLLPVWAGGVAMVTLGYWVGTRAALAALAVTVIVLLGWRLPRGAVGYVRDLTASIFAVGYLLLPAVFVALMLARPDGADSALILVVLPFCSDTAGYAAGSLFGRHLMAPAISPKKTWEGFAGSAVACLAAGGVLTPILLDGRVWQGLVLGVGAVGAATLGDLVESMIKRDLDLKDMGSVLPGHGGILDRVDSLLVAAPVVWLLLTVFIPSR